MTHAHARQIVAALIAVLGAVSTSGPAAAQTPRTDYLERAPEDEIIYFVLPDRFENADPSNDRGGLAGDRLTTGFDPTHKGFYHGGDLKGLTAQLDYIEGLGATAIWLGPIYRNKPVQGPPGQETAGYHGYWITDFTDVDPHFGTKADLKAFIDAAHARGIKVYLDIITNHTADVIALRECHDPAYDGPDKQPADCPYRPIADYPYTTRGGVDGERINAGFVSDRPPHQTPANFEKLVRPDFAYTPYIPAGEENVKVPAWLNDMRYYHNRGNSSFKGESSLYGDFAGLDDLMTEDPRVVEGFIDIFKTWITEFRVDGFRVDTAKHVNPEFWRAFIPAVVEHAKAEGIPNFYVFGEAYILEPHLLARTTHVDGFPAVLDFPLFDAATKALAGDAPPTLLADRYAADLLFLGGEAQARALPVFVGNHDAGRFAHFLLKSDPGMSDETLTKRIRLAHALLFFGRGAPVIYYGDEQGFTGDGHDQDAREDMFESRVASYNDNRLAGTTATTATRNFDRRHPLYKSFARMAALVKTHEPLRRGAQVTRHVDTEAGGGLFAFSRIDPAGGEYLVVLNTSDAPRTAQIPVDPASSRFESLVGRCAKSVSAPGSLKIDVAAYDYVLCRSKGDRR